jgi:ribosomal protein S27AE
MSDPKILQNNRTCATCGSPDLNLVSMVEHTLPVYWLSSRARWQSDPFAAVIQTIQKRLVCHHCGTEHAVPRGEGL